MKSIVKLLKIQEKQNIKWKSGKQGICLKKNWIVKQNLKLRYYRLYWKYNCRSKLKFKIGNEMI